MPKFLIKWEMNTCMLPVDPEQQAKLMTSLIQMLKEDEKAGVCLNWAMFPEMVRGISFTNQNEEDLAARLMKYSPYILFKVKPILSLEQAIRAFQKAGEAKKR